LRIWLVFRLGWGAMVLAAWDPVPSPQCRTALGTAKLTGPGSPICTCEHSAGPHGTVQYKCSPNCVSTMALMVGEELCTRRTSGSQGQSVQPLYTWRLGLGCVTVALLTARDEHHGLGGRGPRAGLSWTAWAPRPLTIEMGIVPTGSQAGHCVHRRLASGCPASGLLTAGASSATVALLAAEPACNRIIIWPVKRVTINTGQSSITLGGNPLKPKARSIVGMYWAGSSMTTIVSLPRPGSCKDEVFWGYEYLGGIAIIRRRGRRNSTGPSGASGQGLCKVRVRPEK